jgi:hypothetical protein
MPWAFSDGFDCYTNSTDMALGYWDTCNTQQAFPAGRFPGGRAVQISGTGPNFVKSSGANESVHHINIAAYFLQSPGASTNVQNYIQLLDGVTPQCTIAFLNNGGIALLSGGTAGATLATYPAGMIVTTWSAYEIEVVVHNSTGSFKVRKNGNPTDDHSTTGIDTAGGTANNYANKIAFGLVNGSPTMYLDDFYWRSDISSVPWWTDIRCSTRPPASDAAVQFSRAPSSAQVNSPTSSTVVAAANNARFIQFTATYTGTISTLVLYANALATANVKVAIYDNTVANVAGLVLGTANVLVNPVAGANTVTFSTPVPVVKGTAYWLATNQDASITWASGTVNSGSSATITYASFPANNPTGVVAGQTSLRYTINIGNSLNYECVNEAQQDAAASYVYDTIPGHADLYGVAPITSTPLQTYAVTTRALAIKSDAGTRTLAVQLKSGGTTVASPTVVLSSTAWQWVWRTDASDPAGGAWTTAAVNNAQIGPLVVA